MFSRIFLKRSPDSTKKEVNMFRSKIAVFIIILNLIGVPSSHAGEGILKTLENRVGVANQSFGISGDTKKASCRIAVSDTAITIGSRFNITPENEKMETIINQVFLFDDKITFNQLDGTHFKAERRFRTPERYCTNSRTGAFYPMRSVETVQILSIEGNKVEITEAYKCGYILPNKKMINRTVCELGE